LGPGRRLRILTFLRHEPYAYELAKTGHDFDVVLIRNGASRPGWRQASGWWPVALPLGALSGQRPIDLGGRVRYSCGSLSG